MSAPGLLLVDDRAENLLALEAVLEPLGHRMVRASSGEEALRHLLVDDIAVIVLDVQMPGLDGFETAEAIKGRDRTRDIPIIFLTALSREDDHRMRGYGTGAVDYIFKPVDPDLLRARVAVFIDLHLSRRRLQQQAELLAWRTAELERSNADLEQFSYIASHDLQEPLRVIAGYLELVADELPAGPAADDARTWIGRSQASAERMTTLVSDLLDYARSTAGAPEVEPVDLDLVLADALEDVSGILDESGGRVDAGPLGRALGTGDELRRVFQNLLANAIRHRGDEPPVIHVRSEPRGTELEVCFSDNGAAVPEGDLQRVFGMFERVANQPSPGTGIGLAICRRIVERAGGRIWMERNQGSGVTVRVVLRAAPA